jgi:hypothetical protein
LATVKSGSPPRAGTDDAVRTEERRTISSG